VLGQAHLQLRHYDEAAASYQNALQRAPENEMALVGSGLMALRQGQSDEAVHQFAHAVKADPDAVNLLLLARALRQAGRGEEAEAAAVQAEKVPPDWNQAQATTGQILSLAGLASIPGRPAEFSRASTTGK
jgi:tetratricopeptide (TPR) repeat protein